MFNGEKLKELRKASKLNQEELGNILGITKSSVCCYEKGTRTPLIRELVKIADYFNVSANILLKRDTEWE
jgi:transcriptional regulator with XRE-family HTH domain